MRNRYFNKLVDLINGEDIDALMIAPSEDMKLILGNSPYLCERFQGLFIKKSGESFYICNLLLEDQIKKMVDEDVKIYTWWDGSIFTDTVKKVFEENELISKTVGVNVGARAFNILEIMDKVDVNFVSSKDLMEEAGIIKDEKELEFLRKSSNIADRAFEEILKFIKPGLREGEIREKLITTMKEFGGIQAGAIVAVGPNSGYPHYTMVDGGIKVKNKDIVLMDFGCEYKGFRSDCTRTVFVGDITEEQKKIYNLVLEANLAGEKMALKGAYIPDIDRAAREIIEKAGYGDKFITRLGHGIGYMRHEAPDIKQSNCRYLEDGMAFTIEPGIYLANNFGVRIEDVLAITKDGTEVLNRTTKEIIIL